MPDTLTVREVAAALRVTQRTVRRWVKDGLLAARKLGRGKSARLRIDAAELARFAGPRGMTDADRVGQTRTERPSRP